jgi:cytochrome c oxidase subunit 3
VLLVSSLMMVLAVHYARLGRNRHVLAYLALTALLGMVFVVLQGVESYIDYQENLIPGWKFVPEEGISRDGLKAEQVPHVQLFLVFYWVMTGFHALHMIIGITVILVMLVLTRRGVFSREYYSPIDVTGLYWHFVDIVWIFLLPMLYLLGTHTF